MLMVDLDIPSATAPTTFLHWIQTDMTVATEATTMTTTEGEMTGYAVTASAAALYPYKSPNPPAKAPLSHRYAQILLDTSGLESTVSVMLAASAQMPVNFDISIALQRAGLTDSVVAWNYFNVTNPAAAAAEVAPSNSTASGALPNIVIIATKPAAAPTYETGNTTSRAGSAAPSGVPSNASRPGVVLVSSAPARSGVVSGVVGLCVLGAVAAVF